MEADANAPPLLPATCGRLRFAWYIATASVAPRGWGLRGVVRCAMMTPAQLGASWQNPEVAEFLGRAVVDRGRARINAEFAALGRTIRLYVHGSHSAAVVGRARGEWRVCDAGEHRLLTSRGPERPSRERLHVLGGDGFCELAYEGLTIECPLTYARGKAGRAHWFSEPWFPGEREWINDVPDDLLAPLCATPGPQLLEAARDAHAA